VRARILLLSLVGSVSYSFHFFFIFGIISLFMTTRGWYPQKKLPALLRFSLLHFLFLFKKKQRRIFTTDSLVSFSRAKDLLILCIKKDKPKQIFFLLSKFTLPERMGRLGEKLVLLIQNYLRIFVVALEMSECFSTALTSVVLAN